MITWSQGIKHTQAPVIQIHLHFYAAATTTVEPGNDIHLRTSRKHTYVVLYNFGLENYQLLLF